MDKKFLAWQDDTDFPKTEMPATPRKARNC